MKSNSFLAACFAVFTIFASASFALDDATIFDGIVSSAYANQTNKDNQSPEALHCLAQNIYFEARGSNLADKVAVADVVLNRKKDRRYPDTICGVVQQAKLDANGNPRLNQCQFSWYCDGKSDNPTDVDRWEEAKLLSYQMLVHNKYRGISEGATHYHATYVSPRWAKDFTLIGRIGEHIFYRWE